MKGQGQPLRRVSRIPPPLRSCAMPPAQPPVGARGNRACRGPAAAASPLLESRPKPRHVQLLSGRNICVSAPTSLNANISQPRQLHGRCETGRPV